MSINQDCTTSFVKMDITSPDLSIKKEVKKMPAPFHI
jgi:hypothetical protein